ncbi:MAG: sterol desaturase family protein [Pseudomonadota bacterium]
MQDIIYELIIGWLDLAQSLCYFFVIFSLLAIIMPCNKDQPIFHKGMLTDILYGMVIPIFSKFVTIFLLSAGFGLIFFNTPPDEMDKYIGNGYGYPATLPLWLQAAIVFFLSDIYLYWAHRFFHTSSMWKWHAIHHSSKTVDWLSAYRFHPVNAWLSFNLVNVIMLMIGFSPESITVMGFFNVAYSYMVHANLNWTFGPFRYVFASPVFHRWHHTTQKEGLDKNFAPTFPFLDIMFGTFYMPKGKLPEHYGIKGVDMPESFIGQLVWPFRQ